MTQDHSTGEGHSLPYCTVLIYSLSCHIVSHYGAVHFAIFCVLVFSREGVRPIPGFLRRLGRLIGVVPQHKQGMVPQLKEVAVPQRKQGTVLQNK